uniref:Uncharacterized protein n=1 Tax=Oryza nivara TaxID=4536 RepID=A0A0E0HEB1_ORYNI
MAATGNAVGCVARREGTRRDKQAAGTSSSPPPGGRLVATTTSGSRMGGGTSARWRRLRRVHLRLARPAAERLRRLRISDGTPHT